MDVAVVGGTGRQGFGIALRLAKAGHRVVIGSRDEERARRAAEGIRDELGSPADVRGAANADAAGAGDVVFLTVPVRVLEEVCRTIAPSLRDGAIVVSTANPLAPEVKARPGEIRSSQEVSAAEIAAGALPASVRLVAGFQHVAASALRAAGEPLEGDVLLCGDDETAKAVVGSLVEDMPNLRWIDAGGLSMARAVERFTGLLISVNKQYGISGAGVRLHGHPSWGRPSR